MCGSRTSISARTILLISLAALMASACTKRDSVEEEPERDAAANSEAHDDDEPCTVVEPCAEAAAEVEPIPADDPRIGSALVIDARSSDSFETWHLFNARNIVYDFLDPTPMEIIEELVALDAPLVVVYGDGQDPDTGEALARDLAGYGVQSVRFIEGGAPQLRGTMETAGRE